MGAVTIGCDLGQLSDYTAIAVAEAETRDEDGREAVHYSIRHLERMVLGTSYPAVARRLAVIAAGIVARQVPATAAVTVAPGVMVRSPPRKQALPVLFVDATGLGRPVVDILKEANIAAQIVPCTFTHGDRQTWGHREITIGKGFLVARLQTLLQTGRIHLPDTSEARALAEELRVYQIRVSENGNDTYGAFSTGQHDDLVTSLGLATQGDPRPRWRLL